MKVTPGFITTAQSALQHAYHEASITADSLGISNIQPQQFWRVPLSRATAIGAMPPTRGRTSLRPIVSNVPTVQPFECTYDSKSGAKTCECSADWITPADCTNMQTAGVCEGGVNCDIFGCECRWNGTIPGG